MGQIGPAPLLTILVPQRRLNGVWEGVFQIKKMELVVWLKNDTQKNHTIDNFLPINLAELDALNLRVVKLDKKVSPTWLGWWQPPQKRHTTKNF